MISSGKRNFEAARRIELFSGRCNSDDLAGRHRYEYCPPKTKLKRRRGGGARARGSRGVRRGSRGVGGRTL